VFSVHNMFTQVLAPVWSTSQSCHHQNTTQTTSTFTNADIHYILYCAKIYVPHFASICFQTCANNPNQVVANSPVSVSYSSQKTNNTVQAAIANWSENK